MPTPRTLLVADDSPTVRKVVGLTFDDEGFSVVAVGSGAEALAEIARQVPDVILADVHMPAPSGYELCARVRADERTRRVPFLLLVGAFEPFDEAEARSCGADGVLTKPFQSIRDLVNKVGGLLGGQHEPSHADDASTLGLSPGDGAASAAGGSTAHAQGGATADASGHESFAAPQARGAAHDDEAARAYSDFDMDDADIESVPASEFDARRHAPDGGTASAADLYAAGVEEYEFADAGSSSKVEAEPPAVVSHESPANTDQQFAASESRAAAPDEPSMTEHGEHQVSQPDESFVSAPDQPFLSAQAEPSASGRQAETASDFAAAPGLAAARAQTFDARADAAADADDTLLELGDIDSPPAHPAADNDFVLDFDDEPRAFARQGGASEHAYAASPSDASSSPDSASHARRGDSSYAEPQAGSPKAEQSYAEPSYEEPLLLEDAPSAVEMQSAGSVSMAEPSAAWDAAQEFTVSPDAVTEPVAARAWQEPEAREATPDRVDVQTVFDAADAQAAHEQAAHEEAAHEEAATGASPDDAASFAREPEAQPASQAAAQLSPESVEAIARRVVELMSDRAVREIAWEVVPDLAERLIRQKLEEERARVR